MSRPFEQQPPAAPRASDPFELWRQIYDTNERAWNAVLERTVNNPAFAESSGKILETFLSAQKTVRENMRQYLEQINLPTREDIARLGQLIVSLEEKIDQLDDRLARLEASLAAPAANATPAAVVPAPPATSADTVASEIFPEGARAAVAASSTGGSPAPQPKPSGRAPAGPPPAKPRGGGPGRPAPGRGSSARTGRN